MSVHEGAQQADCAGQGAARLPESLSHLRLPAIGAPLFTVSNPKLVIAQCKAGIVGCLPALNARPAGLLDEWLHEIAEALSAHDREFPERKSAPFAVNQIVHRSNTRLDDDHAICQKWKVPIIITSLGAREELNRDVHAWGGITFHDVTDDRYARKAVEKGADGLVAVAAGAGGHAGSWSPFALVQEIRQWFRGPLALAGAIATGRSILAARAMGADLAYIGSPFIACDEAGASERYKDDIVAAGAADTINTDYFTGVRANYLTSSIVRVGIDPDQLLRGELGTRPFSLEGSGPVKAWRDAWGCGQGVAVVREKLGVAAYVDRLTREYEDARAELRASEQLPERAG
jgi:nitronate monooxygenase